MRAPSKSILAAAAGVLLVGGLVAAFTWEDEPEAARHPSKALAPGELGPGSALRPPPLDVADLSRVDPGEIMAQAVEYAKTIQGDSMMVRANFDQVRGGWLDMTADSKAYIYFEYRTKRPPQPGQTQPGQTQPGQTQPGQTQPDVGTTAQGSFYLITRNGKLQTSVHQAGSAAHLGNATSAKAFPLPLPKCTASAAARACSIADGAESRLFWEKTDSLSSDQETKWSFRLKGAHGQRCEVDTRDCRVLRSWKRKH